MKRFWLLALLPVMAAGAFLYWWLRPGEPNRAPVDLLPRSTVCCVDFFEPAQGYQRFQSSPLGQKLAAIDWLKVLTTVGASSEEIAAFQHHREELQQALSNPLFQELFGNRLALALVAPAEGTVTASADLSEHLLLVAKPRHHAALLDSFSSWLSRDGTYRLEMHRGISIKIFPLAEGRFLYAAVSEGMLLAALAARPLKECLDFALDRPRAHLPGFADDPQYRTFRSRAGATEDLFGYLDMDRLLTLLEQPPEPAAVTAREALCRRVRESGIQTVTFFREPGAEVQHYTIITKLDPHRAVSRYYQLSGGRPTADETIETVPVEAMMYYRTNWFDPQNYWQALATSSNPDEVEAAQKIEAKVRTNTDRGMAEILAMFGREFSLTVNEFKVTGYFPIPKISCCLAIKDPKGVREVLEKVIAPLPVRRDLINSVPVVSILAVGGLMQPSYAIVGDKLILADSREQIASFLAPGHKYLPTDPDFQKVNVGFTEPSNLIFFARMAKINEGLAELAKWLCAMITLRDPRAGATSKVVLDEVVVPLLDGLKMYKVHGVRGVDEKDEVTLRAAILIEQ